MGERKIDGGVAHKMPADLRKSLISAPEARAAWEDITPLARNEWICWIESAKKQQTRNLRIEKHALRLKKESVVLVAGPVALIVEKIRIRCGLFYPAQPSFHIPQKPVIFRNMNLP